MKTNISNFPVEKHFAALVFESVIIQHESDERSLKHPGHGYPSYDETVCSIKYIIFQSQQEMEAWVIQVETSKYDKTKYKIIESRPLEVKVITKVETN